MGWGFRKSIKIMPGVRLNVGTKSAGLSFGGKGLRYSMNTRSGSRLTASIPGTGVAYSTALSSRPRRTGAYQRRSDLARKQREYEKMQELERAKYEVDLFENVLETIHSIHKECDDHVDWNALVNSSPPFAPGQKGPKQLEAEFELAQFKPSLFDKLTSKVATKRLALEQRIQEAAQEDQADYQAWEDMKTIAQAILSGDTEAYLSVIAEMNPLDDLAEFGSGFEFFVSEDPKSIEVEFDVHSDKVIPKEMKSLTSTGKLSVKAMPKSKYYDLEQDYVCSCAIRIARDLFALLPLDHVYVHAMDERMDSSKGRKEKVTILSVKFDRHALESLSMEHIDCSDAMANFEHKMKFLKTSGFQPVDRLVL
ncbi:DUF4236 domain-containing protein [Brevibacillus parabrevis]|uniref:DUF4236 domain-containing protein n=1 Tax=Brevibacillus parabrevis TaxID=54914 RepID=UPI002E23B914|nr:DUF4236 domain-containing protein [Brevibacillus parabrevis]